MGRSRRRRRQVTLALFCALVGTAIATLGTATALASAPPTGNAEAISFVRSSSHAVNHTDGYQYTQTGFVAMSSAYGRGGATFNWSWGTSAAEPLPSGYTEATEHATIALRGGRIAWVSDDLTATAPITNCTYCLPFDIVLTHSGLVGHFTSIAYTCSFHLGSTPSPWKVGELAGPGPSGDFPTPRAPRWQCARHVLGAKGIENVDDHRNAIDAHPSAERHKHEHRRGTKPWGTRILVQHQNSLPQPHPDGSTHHALQEIVE